MADPYAVTQIYGTADPIPYTDDEVKDIQYVQSIDVLFMTHPNHPIATISRYSDFDWRYEQPEFRGGPYLDARADDADTLLSLTDVLDTATLRANADVFNIGMVGGFIEYSVSGEKALGQVSAYINPREIYITPFEDRCLVLAKETYSPGQYAGWNGTTSTPNYTNPIVAGSGKAIAFSNSSAVSRDMIGNYLRFVDKDGNYHWMKIEGVDSIIEQGAYGIIAKGTVYAAMVPAVAVIRVNRNLTATLNSSSPAFFNLDTDIGRLFRLVLGSSVRHVRGIEYGTNSATKLRVKMELSLPLSQEGDETKNEGATNIWQRGSWFKGNYPTSVCFHEGRLCFSRTKLQPQGVWLSMSGEFYDFSATNEFQEVLANSAINLPLDSDTVNDVCWMVSRGFLLLGTGGSEWQIGANTNREAVTAENATAQVQSSHGSEQAKALSVGRNVLFIQYGGSKLREMRYDYTDDAQNSTDLNTYADHLLRDHNGAIQLAYQPTPFPTVYALLNDGQLGVLSYEPDQQVYAWSRYIIGGPEARVTSITCRPEGRNFAVYLKVRRMINGEEIHTVESLHPEFRPSSPTDRSNLLFLDGHEEVLFSAIEGRVVSGLTNFAGCVVNALVDDSVYHDLTVTEDGQLTLPSTPTTRVFVGFAYRSLLKTFPVEVQGMAGTSQGKLMRINAMVFRLLNTVGVRHGMALDELRDTDFRKDSDPPNLPPPYFTGDMRVTFDGGVDTLGQYYLSQEMALPLNILAIFPELSKFQ